MRFVYSNELYHYGVGHDESPPGRGSGRYPYGSGEKNKTKKEQRNKADHTSDKTKKKSGSSSNKKENKKSYSSMKEYFEDNGFEKNPYFGDDYTKAVSLNDNLRMRVIANDSASDGQFNEEYSSKIDKISDPKVLKKINDEALTSAAESLALDAWEFEGLDNMSDQEKISAFKKALQTENVHVHVYPDNDVLTLSYDDGGTYWGHVIYVDGMFVDGQFKTDSSSVSLMG